MKLQAKGTLIAAGCAALWGVLLGLGMALFGDNRGAPPLGERLLYFPFGSAMLAVILFLPFHTPLFHVLALIGKLPYTFLPFLVLTLFYYICTWPGVFAAEKLGLIEFERPGNQSQ